VSSPFSFLGADYLVLILKIDGGVFVPTGIIEALLIKQVELFEFNFQIPGIAEYNFVLTHTWYQFHVTVKIHIDLLDL
jgi:hypothetical protein